MRGLTPETAHRFQQIVTAAEGAGEAFAICQIRFTVGQSMRPFVAQHVGETCVVTPNQVVEIGSGHRRDVDVAIRFEPTVTAKRNGNQIDIDVVKFLGPQSQFFHFRGHLPVGMREIC